MASRLRRSAALVVTGAIALGFVSAAPARAANTFNPQVTVTRTSSAARAATALTIKITQNDGEEQIGAVDLRLPRNAGFTVNTDAPGADAVVGSIHAVLFTGPTRAPLTIDGTINDDNDARPGCAGTGDPNRQCVIANLNVPGYGTVEAQLEIYVDTSAYRITSDLTGTWADDSVAALDARLSELTATLNATAGPSHVVVKNPDAAGTSQFTWDFTSAADPPRLTGGLKPPCHTTSTCFQNLVTSELAPGAPGLVSPADKAAFLTAATTSFSWGASWDANGDDITYTLLIDDVPAYEGPDRTVSVPVDAGQHRWQVLASDGIVVPDTPSAIRTFTVIDPATAQVFTSAVSGDKLYIVPGAFLYKVNGNSYPGGAESDLATPNQGVIVYAGAFNLVITYEWVTGTAAGYYNHSSIQRPFVDPPG